MLILEELWRRSGGVLEELWRRCGGGLEEVWGSFGGGLEALWRRSRGALEEVWRRVAIWAWIGQKCNTFAKFALQLLNVFAASIGEVCNCRQKQGVDGCVKIARSQD